MELKRRVLCLATLAVSLSGLLVGCDEIFPKRTEGEKLYLDLCADCHGVDGAGNTPQYMGNADADLVKGRFDSSAAEIVVREGVFAEMPAFDDLTRDEMQELLHHIRVLRGEAEPRFPEDR